MDACPKLSSVSTPLGGAGASTNDILQVRALDSAETLADVLAREIAKAEYEILTASSAPGLPQRGLISASLRNRISSGVQYHHVVELHEIAEMGLRIAARYTATAGVHLGVVARHRIRDRFYVIDDRAVIMFSPAGDIQGAYALHGQLIRNQHIIRLFRASFTRLSKVAIPARFAIRLLKADAMQQIERLRRDLTSQELELALCLEQNGLRCHRTRERFPWDPRATKRLAELGLAEEVLDEAGAAQVVFSFSLSEDALRRHWELEGRADDD